MANVVVGFTDLSLIQTKKGNIGNRLGAVLSPKNVLTAPIIIDFAKHVLNSGEHLAIANLNGLDLNNLSIVYQALGANTALSVGVGQIDHDYIDNTYNVDGNISNIDSANVVADKFISSFATTSASTSPKSMMEDITKINSIGFKFNKTNGQYLVIKNTGTANITSGTIVLNIHLFKMI